MKKRCYGNCRSHREGRRDKLPVLRNVLEETAKVDKVLSKFKTIVLQRLMNCSMQELFLLQID